MKKERRMPARNVIYRHWIDGKLIDAHNLGECGKDQCFACGRYGYTERTHITARCNGGDDSVWNIHLLCKQCHNQSEYLEGPEYWDWFTNKEFGAGFFEQLKRISEFINSLPQEELNAIEYNIDIITQRFLRQIKC